MPDPTVFKVGSLQLNNIFEERRKYNRSDMLTFREFEHVKTFGMIRSRQQTVQATDTKFIMFEDAYAPIDFTGSGATETGVASAITTTSQWFNIPTSLGNLKANDKLMLPKIGNLASLGDAASVPYTGEQTIVVTVVENGSNQLVRVIRGNGSGTGTVTAGSGISLKMFNSGSTHLPGGKAPVGLSHQITSDFNYTEIHRDSVDTNEEVVKTDSFVGRDHQRALSQANTLFIRKLERTFLYGIRGINTVNGEEQRKSGGLLWYVSNGTGNYTSHSATNDLVEGNGTSRIWSVTNNTKWTVGNFVKFLERSTVYGSTNKLAICGPGFLSLMANLFEKYITMEIIQFQAGEQAFNLNVVTVRTPNGEFKMTMSEEMRQTGHNQTCFFPDFRYLFNRPMVDIMLESDIQDPDVHKKKDAYFYNGGNSMTQWETHSFIDASNLVY